MISISIHVHILSTDIRMPFAPSFHWNRLSGNVAVVSFRKLPVISASLCGSLCRSAAASSLEAALKCNYSSPIPPSFPPIIPPTHSRLSSHSSSGKRAGGEDVVAVMWQLWCCLPPPSWWWWGQRFVLRLHHLVTMTERMKTHVHTFICTATYKHIPLSTVLCLINIFLTMCIRMTSQIRLTV